MRSFGVIVAVVLGACSFETVAPPCGPGRSCPPGTVCAPGVDRCVADRVSDANAPELGVDGALVDGPAGDGPAGDGPAGDGPAGDGPVQDGAPVEGGTPDGPAPDRGPTYDWKDGDWTTCSPCWGGEQTGDVWCERDDGTPVEDGLCDPGAKPSNTKPCPAPTEVCYWWRAKDSCVHLYGKCGTTDPNEWFQDWDCCSTAALDCDLPNEDCINADVDHCGTCHPDSTCDGLPGQDCNYPE